MIPVSTYLRTAFNAASDLYAWGGPIVAQKAVTLSTASFVVLVAELQFDEKTGEREAINNLFKVVGTIASFAISIVFSNLGGIGGMSAGLVYGGLLVFTKHLYQAIAHCRTDFATHAKVSALGLLLAVCANGALGSVPILPIPVIIG